MIYVIVEGGVVQQVCTDAEERMRQVTIIDYDCQDTPYPTELKSSDGVVHSASVYQMDINPLEVKLCTCDGGGSAGCPVHDEAVK